MIRFTNYSENETAPAIFVNSVGAIYKIGENSLQVVFVRRLRNAEGEWVATAAASLIWDEKDWLDGGKLFRFAMQAYQAGLPVEAERRDGLQ